MTAGRALGLLILAAVIWLYRRYLSGRGPLKRVACTFRGTESCSAYGLRAVREAVGVGEAVRRIRTRLRACGETSLFVHGDQTLRWRPLYDLEPAALEAALVARAELPATRAFVLASRAVVAAASSDADTARSCRDRARALSPEIPRPVFRRAGLSFPVLGCRVGLRLALLAVLFAPALLLLPWKLVALGALFAFVLAVDATIDARREVFQCSAQRGKPVE